MIQDENFVKLLRFEARVLLWESFRRVADESEVDELVESMIAQDDSFLITHSPLIRKKITTQQGINTQSFLQGRKAMVSVSIG